MKLHKLALILAVVYMLISLTACGGIRAREDASDGHIIFETKRNEWVSPDGVHYWEYGGNMVPRYNPDGSLVVN